MTRQQEAAKHKCEYCGAPAAIQDRITEYWICADCLSNQADSRV
jgi:ribosomal protein L37AE/L43A